MFFVPGICGKIEGKALDLTWIENKFEDSRPKERKGIRGDRLRISDLSCTTGLLF